MEFNKPVPIVRIFDEQKAREFYVEYLEFIIDWKARLAVNTPLYMQIYKDECVLHLSENHGDASPGATIRIPVSDLTLYHALLSDKQYRYASPGIISQPWGADEMSVADPFGNRLIFYQSKPS
ncbi:MAG: glyoxalase superfamily protein [Chitinophagaceae bacterium]